MTFVVGETVALNVDDPTQPADDADQGLELLPGPVDVVARPADAIA